MHPLPLLGRGLGEEAELVGAGVVDEDVERAGRLDRGRAESRSVTSRRSAWPPISAATAAAPSSLRSPTQTSAPSAASRREIAAPIPLAPPVTSALRPSSLIGRRSIARDLDSADGREREPIPIIGGTGALGYGLALRWAQAGVPVVIGSRSAERGRGGRGEGRASGPRAPRSRACVNEEAAGRGPIVFLTVPFRAQSETLNNLREALEPGQILVDCTVPLAAAVSGKATRSLGVWQGSAAQQAQEMVPDGVTVVSALHTVSAPVLGRPEAELDEDVLICGDRKADKARVARLIERIEGLRAVNAGALETARIVEQLTPLLISINSPLQDPRRDPHHRAPRRRPLGVSSP